jgi:hypothetical protein
MKKVLLVVALSLSALAGCAADSTDGPVGDEGSRTPDKMILVDSKTPIVLPAEKAGQARTAIVGEARQNVEFETIPELWEREGIQLPLDPKHDVFPCQSCARGENVLTP